MLSNWEIEQVKVQGKHFDADESTWEMVDQMQVVYPSFFSGWGKATWYGGLVIAYGGLVVALWWFSIFLSGY